MEAEELNSMNLEYFPEAHIQLEDEYFGPDELVEKEIMTVDERANTLFATDYTDNPVGYTKEELQGKITDGCGCSINCYSKIDIGELYSHIHSMKELEKSEKDMYIIGKLKCSGVEGNSSVKRKRYTYHLDDRQVCRTVFLVAHDCGIHYLRNVLKHMKENGAVPRTHGNEGRRPKHAFSFEDTKLCITFILNYAGTHGLPQPAAPCNGDGEAPILLPASCTKKELHNLYTEACVDSGTRAGKLTVFTNIWNSCCGHIKIANPRFDVCSRCEYAIQSSTTENQKIESTHALLAHVNLARQEHNVYLDDCRRAKTELSEHSGNNNNSLTDVHYTADFAQCVSLPHRSRQPGPLYFLTCRKVKIFGICQEGRQQINYLIDENETIGKDGSQTHGPNAVISMHHHSLQKHSLGEVLHCDNCPELQFVTADVTLTASPVSVTENSPLRLTCTYTGTSTAELFSMSVSGTEQGALQPTVPDCSLFQGQPDTKLYEYSCPTTYQVKWTVKRVMRANQGDTWKCTVTEATGETQFATHTISVHVHVQSVTMTSPAGSVVTVNENTETVFVCTSAGLPAPTVQWYKDQKTSATNDDVDITISATTKTSNTADKLISVTSTLKYSPTRADNGTKIYCTASNSASTVTSVSKPQLNVYYSPEGLPKINGDTYKVIEHQIGTLSCSIKGGNPLATLSWICFNSRSASVTVDTTVTRNVTWTAERNQDRSCTCQSSHVVAGTQTSSVNVQVLYPPDHPIFKVNGNTVSGPISFIEGKSRNVSCEGNGKPTPNIYSWTKEGKTGPVSRGNTLTFNRVQKQDVGQYSCTVQNTMNPTTGGQQNGTNTSAVNVIVLFAPSSPSFYYGGLNGSPITRSPIDVIRGDTFTIACKSEGQPVPTYRWSGQSSDNQILSVTSVSEHDNLPITCTVNNTMQDTYGTREEGSSASMLTLNVLYPPSINSCTLSYTSSSPVTVTGSIDVIEGSTFSMTCTSSSKPSVDSYSWSGPVTSSSATLTVTTISQQQKGTYTLTAKNTMTRTFEKIATGTDTNSINVDILYSPEVGQLTYKTIEEGSDLNVHCPVVKGNPPDTTFKWIRNDSRVWNQQILYIQNVSRHDDMIYTCTVQNTMRPTGATQKRGEDTGSFHLNVLYKSAINFYTNGHEGSRSVTVNEHADVKFRCVIESNSASIKLIYGSSVLTEELNTNSLSFVHSNTACLQRGVYTCEGINEHQQTSSKNISLLVRCSPRPLHQIKHNMTSSRHNSVTLSFTTLAYPEPGPTGYTWKKEVGIRWTPLLSNTDLHISSSGVQTNLTILNVSQTDYGQYRITVTNDVGQYQQYLFLTEERLHKGTDAQEDHGDDANNEVMIVSVTLGLISAGSVIYAIVVTVCIIVIKRKTVGDSEKQPKQKSAEQRTYINLSFNKSEAADGAGIENRQNETDTSNDGKEESANQYTDLRQVSENDRSTYDVIQPRK